MHAEGSQLILGAITLADELNLKREDVGSRAVRHLPQGDPVLIKPLRAIISRECASQRAVVLSPEITISNSWIFSNELPFPRINEVCRAADLKRTSSAVGSWQLDQKTQKSKLGIALFVRRSMRNPFGLGDWRQKSVFPLAEAQTQEMPAFEARRQPRVSRVHESSGESFSVCSELRKTVRLFPRGALTDPEACGANREMAECKITWKLDTLGREVKGGQLLKKKDRKCVQCCQIFSRS